MIFALASLFAQLLFGWLLADFLSGLFHWAEDRLGPGREHWPLIGPHVFAPNLEHHERPAKFLDSSFVDRNWTTWAAVAPIVAILLFVFGLQPWIVSAAIAGAMANEFHAWAHCRRLAPAWALPLQRVGLIQSPKHHAVHHVPDHRANYCIVTDWLNPQLDRIGFWRGLERLLPEGVIR